MKITTHLLTKNNANTIESCLKSLVPLDGEIIIGDLGSEDDTISICKRYDAKIISITGNRNKIRNEIVRKNKNPWQMYLEPCDVLAVGHEAIMNLKEPNAYFIQVFQGDTISKETRIWNKSCGIEFIQPVHETLNCKNEKFLPGVVIYSTGNKYDISEEIEKWIKENPVGKEPKYYWAYNLLSQNKYKEFLKAGEEYLFLDSSGLSAIMLQYYMGIIQLHLGDTKSASRSAVECIVVKPLMAEFWCLLGDCYYKSKQYKKSIYFYENAMILGKRRMINDLWPVEISKYKKHPTTMIESCKKIMMEAKIITTI